MKARYIYRVGETHSISEDFYYAGFNGKHLKAAVGDWSHNLAGPNYADNDVAKIMGTDGYKGKPKYNGGVIGSRLVQRVLSTAEHTGDKLVKIMNAAIEKKYADLGIGNVEKNRELAFTGNVAHVMAYPDVLRVTAVGDVRIAADGKVIAGKTKRIDVDNAIIRRDYIRETGDLEGSVAYVKPKILEQFKYQNTTRHKYSYSVIDGTKTPKSGVEVLEIPTPRRLLLWSDGYIAPEDGDFTIEGLERMLRHVYDVDPYRCEAYPAVSHTKDDRTALEIHIDGDWNRLAVEEIKPRF